MSGPLDNPAVRYAVCIGPAAMLAAVALYSLDGSVMYAVLGVAVLDALVAPQLLNRAVT